MHTPDPLRFLPFRRRYQTHNGNGVPLGLMFNGPDSNIVFHFADVLSGSRGTLTQEDGSKGPQLLDQSGIPFLRLDGSDDCLTESFTLAQPHAVILAYRNQNPRTPGDHDIVFDGATLDNCLLTEDNRPWLHLAAGIGGMVKAYQYGANGVFSVVTAIYDGDHSTIRVNGQQIADEFNAGSNTRNGLTLGSTAAARTAAIDVIACLIPKHLADVSLCEQYLQTLMP